MAVFGALQRVHSDGQRVFDPACPRRDIEASLHRSIACSAPERPLLLMLHGGGFSFGIHKKSADNTLYSISSQIAHWRRCSWVAQAMRHGMMPTGTVTLAYSWNVYAGVPFRAPRHRLLYQRAGQEAACLAGFLDMLGRVAPDREVDILAGGTGARMVLQALRLMRTPCLGRVVFMGAQEFGAETLCAMQTPTAKAAAFYNFSARRNRRYDRMFNRAAPRPGRLDQAIGLEYPFARSNWVNLCLDRVDVYEALAAITPALGRPAGRFCPRSFKLQPGQFALLRDIYNRRAGFGPEELNIYLMHPVPHVQATASRAADLPLPAYPVSLRKKPVR